jgi:hypothetical protein
MKSSLDDVMYCPPIRTLAPTNLYSFYSSVVCSEE